MQRGCVRTRWSCARPPVTSCRKKSPSSSPTRSSRAPSKRPCNHVAAGKHTFEVAPEDAGLRLDQVIPKHVPGLSRRKTRAVIDLGGVFVDRARVKVAGRPVKPGQRIEVNIGGAVERAEPPPAPRIVHTDAAIIVVDKPAGLVTAPTPEASRGDLLDQLSRQFGEVYLVHRIVLPTCGLLVFARTRDAKIQLGDTFKLRDVDRECRAVAVGEVAAQPIDRPIDRKRAVEHVTPLEELVVPAAPTGAQ